ncbi:MAG: tetratricopeptide repeat protein [bacterium]|nr:MAG: tetratricopeptide repeat protein [bacterium]
MKVPFFRLALALALVTVLCPAAASAASLREEIDPMVAQKRFDEAEARLQEVLGQDPGSVDAHMLMGNLTLYRFLDGAGQVEIAANTRESVFEPDIGFIREPLYIVPPDVGRAAAGHYLEALTLDPARGDIHRGLAYTYAMALMKDELLARFPVMFRELPGERSTLMFNMGDYARMLRERGRLDWCLEAYGVVLELYPDHPGVLSDVAGVYALEGQPDKAVATIRKALGPDVRDEFILGNGIVILTVAGDHAGALAAMERSEEHRKGGSDKVFRALKGLAEGREEWKKALDAYPEKDGSAQEDELARFLLSEQFRGDFEGFSVAEEKAQSPWARLLVYRWGMRAFALRGQPFLYYAVMQAAYGNHAEALEAFAQAEERAATLDVQEKQALSFYQAWSLQDSGRTQKADGKWREMIKSGEFYIASAAAYFLGRNLYTAGRPQEAVSMWETVSDRAGDSKYSTLAFNAILAVKEGRLPAFAR